MSIVSIVVGIDGSEESLRALSFSVGLANRESARVSACFVTHQGVNFGLVSAVDDEDYAKQLEQVVYEELKRADVVGSFFHREGDIAHELIRLADEVSANLIAVGRPKHPVLHVGSVPKRLLEDSRHPVLMVP